MYLIQQVPYIGFCQANDDKLVQLCVEPSSDRTKLYFYVGTTTPLGDPDLILPSTDKALRTAFRHIIEANDPSLNPYQKEV